MAKRKKEIIATKIDGLGPKDIKRIRSALRKVWGWSYSRKLVIIRCTGADGFATCEGCKRKCPKIFVDHITKVGNVDGGFIKRLWTPSKNLQGLCGKCHAKKTRAERMEEKDFF